MFGKSLSPCVVRSWVKVFSPLVFTLAWSAQSHLSFSLSLSVSDFVSVCVSLPVSVSLCLRLSVSPSLCLSVSAFVSVCACLSVSLSVSVCHCPCLCLDLCLSVCVLVSHCLCPPPSFSLSHMLALSVFVYLSPSLHPPPPLCPPTLPPSHSQETNSRVLRFISFSLMFDFVKNICFKLKSMPRLLYSCFRSYMLFNSLYVLHTITYVSTYVK